MFGKCLRKLCLASSLLVSLQVFGLAPEDDWLNVEGRDHYFEVGVLSTCVVGTDDYADLDCFFEIDSGSEIKTLSLTGLPTGLRFDARTRRISGKPTKAGVYYVTLSATNANKFQFTSVVKWCVGTADNGDYDNIDLNQWFDLDDITSLCTGERVDFCTSLKSITGLPTGLKFTAGSLCYGNLCTTCSGFVSGMPTKAGKYKLTFLDYYGNKAVQTVVVQSHGSRYFSAQSSDDWCGTVRGSGVYAVGSKISLSASPKSGYYFAGWYCDPNFDEPFDYGDKDYRNPTQSVLFDWDMARQQSVAYARFVSKWEDSNIYVDCPYDWTVDTTYTGDTIFFSVESLTVPTVTVKGLPAGIKYDSANSCLYVANQSQLKPGLYFVTITAKNKSGASDTAELSIRVPNLRSSMIWNYDGGEAFDYDGAYYLYVGQWADCCSLSPTAFSGETDIPQFLTYSTAKVTASGLPPGIKLYNDKYSSENWYGFTGAATKAGTYTVTLTIKDGGYTEKATFTIVVEPFPAELTGKYNGTIEYDGWVYGTLSFTVDAKGKVSAKAIFKGTTVNFSGYLSRVSDGQASLYLYLDKGCWECLQLKIDYTRAWDTAQVSGTFRSDCLDLEYDVYAQRNPFGKNGSVWENPEAHDIAQALAARGRMNLASDWSYEDHDFELMGALCVDAPSGTLPMSVTVKADGTVSLTGKLGGSYSMTGTGVLRYDDEHDNPYVDIVATVPMKICAYMTANGSQKCVTVKRPVHVRLEFPDWWYWYCCPYGYADEIY